MAHQEYEIGAVVITTCLRGYWPFRDLLRSPRRRGGIVFRQPVECNSLRVKFAPTLPGMHIHDRLEVLLIHFTDALNRKALFCPFRNAKRHVISEQTIGAKRAGRHAVVARCATSPASALAIAG